MEPHPRSPPADSAALSQRCFAAGALVADTAMRRAHHLIIESGLVAVLAGGPAERGACVSVVGRGAVIGPDLADAASAGLMMTCLALCPVQGRLVAKEAFEQALYAAPALHAAYARHLQARATASHQIAACRVTHALAGRCAHWLLQLRAWFGDMVPVTHACLATILGARRAGVGVTLQTLRQAGAIDQMRGCIRILDPAAIGAIACGCPVRTECDPDLLSHLASMPAPTAMGS